ncbi:MAG TPA: thioredoxin family protein [Acidimicrobiales bacterium]|nr:thioredoxin family protein [Acidimicrobiales bacterium]
MMRVQLVLLVVTLVGLGNLGYRRRLAGLQVTGDADVLPVELRGPGPTWVVFTTPTCVTCGPVVDVLRSTESSATVTAIDASSRPDLSDALSVRAAPTVLRANADGVIDLRLAGPAAASEFFSLRPV